MIASCTGNTKHRPNFDDVCAQLHKAKPTKKGIVDVMMDTMENYMENLEIKVMERTKELQEVSECHQHNVKNKIMTHNFFSNSQIWGRKNMGLAI